ncbi:MAG: glycosyltransferase family 39 protein [Crenarchaeota archaeon]|nr:glycosyltransferase family 39 protein [Thermoproteota archaeon]
MSKRTHFELLAITSILAVSAILRLWNIEGYPRWYCDEGTNAHLGLNILEGVIGYKTWGPNFFPPLFDIVQGASLLLLGNNYFAVRLPAALFGLLSIMVLYFIAKKFLDGLFWVWLTSMLFSLGSMHINRMGLQHNASLLFILLTMYLLLKDANLGKRWFLAGFSAGLAFLSHYTGGVIAGILVLLVSLYEKRLRCLLNSMIGASLPLTTFLLMGILTAPHWFIYDLIQQGSRTFSLFKILVTMFVSTPFGWEFKYPLGGAPIIIYGLTLVGALASISLLFTAKQNPMLIAFISASIIGLILSKDIWWSFLLYLYPAYTISFVVLLKECYQERKIMTMVLFLTPSILQLLTLYNLVDAGSFFIFLVLMALSPLSHFIPKKVVRSAKLFSKALLSITVVLYTVVLPLSLDIPLIFSDTNADKRDLLDILNIILEDGDLVALPPEFLPLISKGIEGVDFAHLAFCYTRLPQFLYWDVETYLMRIKPRYCEPLNYKAIILTYDYGLPITEMTGKMLIDALLNKWPSFLVGRHILFLNPISLLNASDLGSVRLNVPFTNVTFAYAMGIEQYSIEVLNQSTLLFEFTPAGSHGWFFLRISFPEPFNAHENLLIVAKFSSSTNMTRFVIKPLDIAGHEVLPWATKMIQQGDSDYLFKFYPLSSNSLKVGGLIVGVDWSDPRMVDFVLSNTTIKVHVDYIVLITQIGSSITSK